VNVRVVLDTSALLAYARLEGIAVGELVVMVEEDGGGALVGVPADSFVSAYLELAADNPARDDRAGDECRRLVDLATKIDGVTAILPLLGADAVEVAELDRRLGGRGTAHAIVEVRTRGALLATYDGKAARTALPDDAVLDL
jgi:hypothetical protein